MRFFHRTYELTPRTVVLFPGSFHPPTVAHLEVAKRALIYGDEIVFVMPQNFPHKSYDGVGPTERMLLVAAALEGDDRFSVAQSEGGLFLDMAREYMEMVPYRPRIMILCGRDAAERVVGWDYGSPGALANQLDEYELLVAARSGAFDPPFGFRTRIHTLPMVADMGHISASEVRRRIRAQEPWQHLVPQPIVDQVGILYG